MEPELARKEGWLYKRSDGKGQGASMGNVLAKWNKRLGLFNFRMAECDKRTCLFHSWMAKWNKRIGLFYFWMAECNQRMSLNYWMAE